MYRAGNLLALAMIFLATGSAAQESLVERLGQRDGRNVRPLVSAYANSLYYPLDEANSEAWSRPGAPAWPDRGQQQSSLAISLVQLAPVLLRLLASLHRLLTSLSSPSSPTTGSNIQPESRPSLAPPQLASSSSSQVSQLEPLLTELGKQLLGSILQASSSGSTSLTTRQGAQQASNRPWWAHLSEFVGPLVQASSQLSQAGLKQQASAARQQAYGTKLGQSETPMAPS